MYDLSDLANILKETVDTIEGATPAELKHALATCKEYAANPAVKASERMLWHSFARTLAVIPGIGPRKPNMCGR